MPPYQSVRFIGHSLCAEPIQIQPGQLAYMGLNDQQADYHQRCLVVNEAIQTAVQHVPVDPTCLTIYMMPEFFFRGNAGAYPVERLSQIVLSLQQLVRDDTFQDWLFVFGTILSTSLDTETDKNQVYNHCLVQKGGATYPLDQGRLVIKEFKSTIDFIQWQQLSATARDYALADEYTAHLERVAPLIPGLRSTEWQKRNDDGHCIFVLDGLTIGVEICLDHAAQRISASMAPPELDIQLVTSCGMQLQDGSLNLRDGGVAFCTDGATQDGHVVQGNWQKTEMRTRTGNQITHLQGTNHGQFQVVPLNIPAAAALFNGGAGNLKIYPSFPLP
ncbi:hypothetical protein RAS12_03890 [Achromobacter seleniivolatilans]|uniref:CN hydrolase domain-containing protein n=1 Tax=Achromobacter seleniivolatilans TaxID=3047478 RepID=A0ABY9M3F2_9BURK|nr:hypothetical protein [Achromobacter sp. R39]WMD21524.1 hypothetical protein RAS12_03890 [Achromobacter sp. R39]